MPTYEYVCKQCGEGLEVVQSFSDPALTSCTSCGGPLRKVFGNVGIVFKGSGFYKTDNRSTGASSSAKAGGEKATPTGSGDASSNGTATKEPAAATSTTTTSSSSSGGGSDSTTS